MKPPLPLADGLRDERRASSSGNDLLVMGLSVGAMGLAGAALGAVCPICVVATPTLLGLGAVQKLRALVLARRAKAAAAQAEGDVAPR